MKNKTKLCGLVFLVVALTTATMVFFHFRGLRRAKECRSAIFSLDGRYMTVMQINPPLLKPPYDMECEWQEIQKQYADVLDKVPSDEAFGEILSSYIAEINRSLAMRFYKLGNYTKALSYERERCRVLKLAASPEILYMGYLAGDEAWLKSELSQSKIGSSRNQYITALLAMLKNDWPTVQSCIGDEFKSSNELLFWISYVRAQALFKLHEYARCNEIMVVLVPSLEVTEYRAARLAIALLTLENCVQLKNFSVAMDCLDPIETFLSREPQNCFVPERERVEELKKIIVESTTQNSIDIPTTSAMSP